MLFEFLEFWWRETMANIRRNRLMSMLAVSTVTIGLFILGAFYLTITAVRTEAQQQTKKLDLVIFLDKDIKPARRKQLFEAARMPQVEDVKIALSHQVMKEYSKELFQNIPIRDMENERPFNDELRIKLKDPENYWAVRAYFTRLKGVQSVYENKAADDAARMLLSINRFITISGFIALVVLGLAILLIIHNAIRLTVYARRREIRIMHLVGATPSFIRVPFLLEGMVYGVTGASLAVTTLGVLVMLAKGSGSKLVQSMAPAIGVFGACVGILLAAGIIFGVVGAAMSFNHSQKSAGV